MATASRSAPSRRERLRAQAFGEIREHGYAQIAEGGPTALSLNGIAKAMGMSGPAMYRYFASRDELLSTLVTESYEDLAETLEQAARQARRRTPEGRVRATMEACRVWAVAQPHRYRLVFGSTYGSGALDPDRIIPAAHRSMSVILTSLAGLSPGADGLEVSDTVLRRELVEWGRTRSVDQAADAGLLLLGLAGWTRMHGIISLEIEGFFDQLGVDAARVYEAEVDHLIAQGVGHT